MKISYFYFTKYNQKKKKKKKKKNLTIYHLYKHFLNSNKKTEHHIEFDKIFKRLCKSYFIFKLNFRKIISKKKKKKKKKRIFG